MQLLACFGAGQVGRRRRVEEGARRPRVTEDDGGRWTGRRRGDGCPRRIGNFMDWTFRRRQSVWSVMAVDASRGRLDRDETASREYLPFRDGPFGACPWAVSPRRTVPKLAPFLFLYFSKTFFTEIYFQYHNLQFCTPTARQGGSRGPAAQQRGGRDLYVN